MKKKIPKKIVDTYSYFTSELLLLLVLKNCSPGWCIQYPLPSIAALAVIIGLFLGNPPLMACNLPSWRSSRTLLNFCVSHEPVFVDILNNQFSSKFLVSEKWWTWRSACLKYKIGSQSRGNYGVVSSYEFNDLKQRFLALNWEAYAMYVSCVPCKFKLCGFGVWSLQEDAIGFTHQLLVGMRLCFCFLVNQICFFNKYSVKKKKLKKEENLGADLVFGRLLWVPENEQDWFLGSNCRKVGLLHRRPGPVNQAIKVNKEKSLWG